MPDRSGEGRQQCVPSEHGSAEVACGPLVVLRRDQGVDGREVGHLRGGHHGVVYLQGCHGGQAVREA